MDINKLKASVEHNNMQFVYLKTNEELMNYLDTRIKEGSKVSVGGSMTLFETGVIDYLKTKDIQYLDRYQEGLSQQELFEVFNQALTCDTYITSTNAITMDGCLYNVDRTGNRVAAMIYGPKEVLVICGTNKIVEDVDEAVHRVEEVAAPLNCVRLKTNTPCIKTKKCMHCSSNDKLCNTYTLLGHQLIKDRITIILLEGDYGY